MLNHHNKVASVQVVTRVEDIAQVTMLGRDGNPHNIPVPWHNRFNDVQEYYYWIAAEMKYRITVTFNVRRTAFLFQSRGSLLASVECCLTCFD